MKRLLSALISLCMTLGMIITPAAAETITLRATEAEQMGFLQKLEIIDTVPDATELDDELTRAEFIMYIGNIVGIWNNEKEKRYFTDVPMDHWAADAINELYEMNILSKDETQNFRPKDKITMGEATKIIVMLLGYGKYAETLGEFPGGYMKAADYLGIDVGSASTTVTKRDAMRILYETIQAPFCDEKVKGEDYRTILSYYYNIYSYTGLLTEASGISMYGDANENEKMVVIDGDNYLSDIDLSEKLGRNLSFFYKQVNDNVTPEIVYLVSGKDKGKSFEILSEDFIEYTDGELWYTDGDAAKKIKVPQGAEVIKNGTMEGRNIVKAFEIKKGKIQCVDTDGNGDYDYFFIWDYDNIVIDRISTNDILVYDKIVSDKKVSFDPEDRTVYICDTAGTRMSFESLAKGDVVSVYESKDYIKAVVCRNSNTGTVFGLENDDDEHYLLIGKNENDENKYQFDNEFYADCLDSRTSSNAYKLEIGSTITYWIDAYGKIAYIDFKSVSGNWQFGYLIRTYRPEEDDNRVGFRLYNENSEITNYLLAERVSIDGNKCETATAILNAMDKVKQYQKRLADGEDSINGQIIRFKTNSDGEIKNVDTEKSDDSAEGKLNLHRTYNRSSRYYYWNSHNFGGEFVRSSSAKIFIVPEYADLADADPDDFRIATGGYFGDYYYNIEAFRIDKSMGSEDVLVVYGTTTKSYSRSSSIVEKVYQAIDKNEEVKWYADCYEFQSGRKFTITSEDEDGFNCMKYDKNGNKVEAPDGISSGDIIRHIYGTNDFVSEALIIYDYSEEKNNQNSKYGWMNGAGHSYGEQVSVAKAFVKYSDSEMMSLGFAPLTREDYASDSEWKASYSAIKTGGIVFIAEDKGGKIKITKGTFDDIIPADADGYDKARDYIIFTWLGRIYGGVIYR